MAKPLSFEEYSDLLDQGLSEEDIDRFEAERLGEKKPKGRSFIAKAYSTTAKGLSAANQVLNYLSSQATKQVYGPLAEQLPIREEAKSRIVQLKESPELAYPSDVAEQVAPGLFKHKVAGESELTSQDIALNTSKILLRLGIDIAGDPLTPFMVGVPTKLGRVLSVIEHAKQAGKPIKLSSEAA